MDHSYFRDKISSYSDGALEAQERELIRRHLEDCAECRKLLEKLNQLSAVIEEKSGLKNDEYFENLAKKIERRIATPEEKVVDVRELRWNSFWWKISAAAATIVLVGTIGFYQYEDGQEMLGKVLENFQVIPESVLVNTDSVSANEEAEVQGGRTGSKELVGKVTETETPQVKKEESNAPLKQEKVKQIEADKDLLMMKGGRAPTVDYISDSSELKEKVASKEPPTIAKTNVSIAVVDEAMRFDAVSDSMSGQQLSLSQWRSQRDSIQIILSIEADTLENSLKSRLNDLVSPSASGLVQSTDSSKDYLQLANCWYQIGSQTQDSTEKAHAVQFLNWYKNRFPSDSPTVNIQLQQIPK